MRNLNNEVLVLENLTTEQCNYIVGLCPCFGCEDALYVPYDMFDEIREYLNEE